MPPTIELTLSERRLAVHVTARGGQKTLVPDRSCEPARDWRPVVTLPQALVDAITDAALHLNMREPGDDRHADLRAFSQAVRGGDIALSIAGPPRELGVCDLYLAVEFNLVCGQKKGQVRLRPDRDSGPSVYDTMGVDLSLQPIERMAEDESRYRELMAQTGGKAEAGGPSSSANTAWQRLVETKRIRMGVLGDTGMGKSTFINGVLRRPGLLPEHTDVCTGVVVELQYATSREDECFKVNLLAPDERDALCLDSCGHAEALLSTGGPGGELETALERPFWKRFKRGRKLVEDLADVLARKISSSDVTRPAWIDRKNEHAEKMTALEDVCGRAQSEETRRTETRIWDLSQIAKYVQARNEVDRYGGTRLNGWPLITQSLTVRLHEPLLQHVVLVDTPGLRDLDPVRAGRTTDELTHLNGWIYLVDAETKGGTPQLEGIQEMRERVHVPHGIIAANKMDMLVAQVSGRGIDRLFAARKTALQREGCPVVPCAAKAAAFLPLGRPDRVQDLDQAGNTWRDKPWGWQLVRGRVPTIPVESRTDIINARAAAVFDGRITTDETAWRTLVDFQLDSSELVNVVRELCDVLEGQVITYLVRQHRRDLAGSIETHRGIVASELQSIQRQLSAVSRRQELNALFIERDTERDELYKQREQRQDEIERAQGQTREARRRYLDDAIVEGKRLRNVLETKARNAMDDSVGWQLRGWVDFSIHGFFTEPLATKAGAFVEDFGEDAVRIWSEISFLDTDDLEPLVGERTQNFNLEEAFSGVKVFESFWESFDTTKQRGARRARATAEALQILLLGERRELDKLRTDSIRSDDSDKVPGLKKVLEASKKEAEGRMPTRLTLIEEGLTELANREISRLDSQIQAKTLEIKALKQQIEDAENNIHKPRTALDQERKDRQSSLANLDRFLDYLGFPHQEPDTEPQSAR